MSLERQQVLKRLAEAVRRLEECPEFALLVPEVRSNIAYSIEQPRSPADVGAVDGRITVVAGRPHAAGPPAFGASDHMARLVIEARRHDPTLRAGLNFRWNEQIHKSVSAWCRRNDLALGLIDRAEEPRELVGRDGASMPWKVEHLVHSTGGRVPPVFYENRGWGKEPLFFMLGPDPLPLAGRVVEIAREFAASA